MRYVITNRKSSRQKKGPRRYGGEYRGLCYPKIQEHHTASLARSANCPDFVTPTFRATNYRGNRAGLPKGILAEWSVQCTLSFASGGV